MRASDIIRSLLDLMDEIDCPTPEPIPAHADMTLVLPANDPIVTGAENPLTKPVDQNHFRQIFDILSAERNKMYSNSPAEVIAGVESVTTDAGGGTNGPKNPADLRAANSFSMFPAYQAEKK